jgi:hypothetical protein
MAARKYENGRDRATDPGPPGDLPADPRDFWRAAAGFEDLASAPDRDQESVLKKLGPLPFPKGRFPLMGFLATLYDHVADHVRDALSRDRR